jgi:hypothetical protein
MQFLSPNKFLDATLAAEINKLELPEGTNAISKQNYLNM